MLVIPADFGWADIGDWRSLYNIAAKNKGDNVAKSNIATLDSRGNLLYSFSGKLIATVAVDNMALVETEETIFLCPLDRVEEVKKLLQKMVKNNKQKCWPVMMLC